MGGDVDKLQAPISPSISMAVSQAVKSDKCWISSCCSKRKKQFKVRTYNSTSFAFMLFFIDRRWFRLQDSDSDDAPDQDDRGDHDVRATKSSTDSDVASTRPLNNGSTSAKSRNNSKDVDPDAFDLPEVTTTSPRSFKQSPHSSTDPIDAGATTIDSPQVLTVKISKL